MSTFTHEEHAKLRWIAEVVLKDYKQKYQVSDHTSTPVVLHCPYVPIINAEVESRLLHIFANRLVDSALHDKNKQEQYAMTLQPKEEFRFGQGPPNETPIDPTAAAQPRTETQPHATSGKVRKPKKQVRKKAVPNGGA
jgi:hypothetical protein